MMNYHVFVVMSFGVKEARSATPAADARTGKDAVNINFDEVYESLIAPALAQAACLPFRADKEEGAGDIRTDMFFELVTADIVVADISILNPNVFYELGIRHGVAPRGVFMIHGGWSRRPFDVAPDRTFDYDGRLFECPPGQRDGAWQSRLEAEIKKLAKSFKKAIEADAQTDGSPVYKELKGLQPVDWSGIETARANYFGQVFAEWKARVQVAKLNGLPGDILTLAEDAPTRFHRGKLLWESARALISLNRFAIARSILEELLTLEPKNLDALAQMGLVLSRLGKTNEARVHMTRVVEQFGGEPEAHGILGRVYKDLWRLEWDKPDAGLKKRQREAVNHSAFARSAIDNYDIAFRRHIDSYYNGINVVSLMKLLKHLSKATGKKAGKIQVEDLGDLVAVVRQAAKAAITNEAIWPNATLGEIALVEGDAAAACEFYRNAVNAPETSYFQVDSMLCQINMFERLDFRPRIVANVKEIIEQRLNELEKPYARFKKVAIASGHMIDKPERPTPRFPAEKEAEVRRLMAQRLNEWKIGAGDLAICGGARGADILFAELCAERGAEVWLYLSLPESEFLEESIRLPDSDWENRFFALRGKPGVKTDIQSERLKAPPKDASVFARNNLWIINTARVEAKEPRDIYALLVWDEQPTGDGPGGTSDFASRVRRLGGHLKIINPTKLGDSNVSKRKA